MLAEDFVGVLSEERRGGDLAADAVRRLRNHGSPARSVHSFGFNSRLDDVHAAILSVKLKRITEWTNRRRAIAALYTELLAVAPSPVVALNHAVAVAMSTTPAEGLALIDRIDGLDRYHLLHAARADMLRRLDRPAEALAAYTRALELAPGEADRAFLQRRRAEMRRSL